jgi:hypothetical protein
MYKLLNNLKGNPIGVKLEKDGFVLSIPFVAANTDYQKYLKWVSEGGVALPADEPASQPADEV